MHVPHACYMSRLPHPLWFEHINNITCADRQHAAFFALRPLIFPGLQDSHHLVPRHLYPVRHSRFLRWWRWRCSAYWRHVGSYVHTSASLPLTLYKPFSSQPCHFSPEDGESIIYLFETLVSDYESTRYPMLSQDRCESSRPSSSVLLLWSLLSERGLQHPAYYFRGCKLCTDRQTDSHVLLIMLSFCEFRAQTRKY
jgi:hypothetical protein